MSSATDWVRHRRWRAGAPVRNWARNQACVPTEVVFPTSIEEVSSTVSMARDAGRRVRVIGAGHSFTAAAMTDGVLMCLDRMADVLDVDRDGCRVRVQAGITLAELSRWLDAEGLALENLGDIDVQSLAGAIATGTHGTGAAFGGLATQVEALTLVDGCGDVRVLDAVSTPEEFAVSRVSLGALGVVCEVTLRCVPAFRLHARETIEVLDDLLGDVGAVAASADHAEFFWMPGARRCQVKRNTRTDAAPQPQGRVGYVRDKIIAENVAFGAVCRVGRRWPALAPRIARLVSSSVSEREFIDVSHRVFASPRHVRFVEMEYGIPVENLGEAMSAVREVTSSLAFPALFPIEVRFSAADDIALSPGFGRANAWVAVHQYRGAPYEAYFQRVAQVMDGVGGRPHWGKMHFLSAADLAPRYSQWDAFASVRRRFDPDGVFTNEYIDRVLGPVR